MSMTAEAPVEIKSSAGTIQYAHFVAIPSVVCAGEEYGARLGWRVLRKLREVAMELHESDPLLFPVRRIGDLNSREIERVTERQAQIIAKTFLDFKASPAVGRQLVTFAVCRWGHSTKRFSAILCELNKQQGAGAVQLWHRTIKKNATDVAPPSYMGARDTA